MMYTTSLLLPCTITIPYAFSMQVFQSFNTVKVEQNNAPRKSLYCCDESSNSSLSSGLGLSLFEVDVFDCKLDCYAFGFMNDTTSLV